LDAPVVEVVFESVGELVGVCRGLVQVWFEEFGEVVDVFGDTGSSPRSG
jgi:hypothetical protein